MSDQAPIAARMHAIAKWLVIGATLLTATTPLEAQSSKDLRSFFVQLAGEMGDDIVSVEQVGPDVRVRVIRVTRAHHLCANRLVYASQAILPDTSVQAVAGVSLCKWSVGAVDRAAERARRYLSTVDFFGSIDTLVADCGGRERVFPFRQRPGRIVIEEVLGRQNPEVLAMWTLGRRLASMVGVETTSPEREALGTSLLPELVSGKFEAAFRDWCVDTVTHKTISCRPNYLAWQLEGYQGPPSRRGPLPIEPRERDSLRFSHYVAPEMPMIALSARVFGDVRLRLTADRETGAVTSVEVRSGVPLLTPAAVAAARQWRFALDTVPTAPVEVTLPFQIVCPAQ